MQSWVEMGSSCVISHDSRTRERGVGMAVQNVRGKWEANTGALSMDSPVLLAAVLVFLGAAG